MSSAAGGGRGGRFGCCARAHRRAAGASRSCARPSAASASCTCARPRGGDAARAAHAPADPGVRASSSLWRSPSSTSCCPSSAGVGHTVHRIERGESGGSPSAWRSRLLSFASYVVLFRCVFVRGLARRIGWRESYQITMAGLAATRLFAAGGAGGVALTAWALRRSGMAGARGRLPHGRVPRAPLRRLRRRR